MAQQINAKIPSPILKGIGFVSCNSVGCTRATHEQCKEMKKADEPNLHLTYMELWKEKVSCDNICKVSLLLQKETQFTGTNPKTGL